MSCQDANCAKITDIPSNRRTKCMMPPSTCANQAMNLTDIFNEKHFSPTSSENEFCVRVWHIHFNLPITHSLKGQQRKRYLAFQLTGTSIKVLKMCIQHWKQDSLLGLSVSVSTSKWKCWRQIYTEAKDWKAQLDNLSVSHKGAGRLSLTQSLLCLLFSFVALLCSCCLFSLLAFGIKVL